VIRLGLNILGRSLQFHHVQCSSNSSQHARGRRRSLSAERMWPNRLSLLATCGKEQHTNTQIRAAIRNPTTRPL
jgi:hypothetical protein